MPRQVILLFIFPILAFGQRSTSTKDVALTKIYIQAISDFIKAANKKNKTKFDTLYFGNRKDGDPYNDFPDIELPETIEETQIKLISPERGETVQLEKKSSIYINMMGWVNEQNAEFIFVVFSNGFHHQYDYHLNYSYDLQTKVYALKKTKFIELPAKK